MMEAIEILKVQLCPGRGVHIDSSRLCTQRICKQLPGAKSGPPSVCVCGLSRSVVSNSCYPTAYNLPSSSVHGILQARVLKWVAFVQGIFLTQGSNPGLLVSCIGKRILYH